MKILPITFAFLAFLSLVESSKIKKNVTLINEKLDIIDQEKLNIDDEAEDQDRPLDAQRKRDSGYSYVRPIKFPFNQRHEPLFIRSRIINKRPLNSQTIRPFNTYGPPRYRQQSTFVGTNGNGNGNNANQQQDLQISINDFTGGQNIGSGQQRVPSPIRHYEFVELSPIAGQNNVPFNSNDANYLPPRNQRLPVYETTRDFGNQLKSDVNKFTRHRNQQQTFSQNQQQTFSPNQQPTFSPNQQQSYSPNQQESQKFLKERFPNHQQQISDAALFLTQNSQAISQLYDAPAPNENYQPTPEIASTNDHATPNFPNFLANEALNLGMRDNSDSTRYPNPSYASGILDRETLRGIQSLEKDRLITQLQDALVDSQGKQALGANGVGYSENHENNDYTQSIMGTRLHGNSAVGPQLDRPNDYTVRRPYGVTGGFLPVTSSTTPGTLGYPYGSTTPSAGQTLLSTTIATSTSSSSAGQVPNRVIGSVSQGTNEAGTSVVPPNPTTNFQYPQYGGFVPSLVGTNFLTSYPTYATNFFGSESTNINHGQSNSPTQFGIPIPALPVQQGTNTFAHNPISLKPDSNFPQQQPAQVTPIHGSLPIQPINPIIGNPLHTNFPLVPAVNHFHGFENSLGTTNNLAHPSYGVQQTVGNNHLLVKPIKPLYPVYYYPNILQIQKPGIGTLPWNYAPAYGQTKPAQGWK